MAFTLQEFLAKTKAEKVAGQLIVGIKKQRVVVGTVKDGVFTINEEGKAYLAQLDAPMETPVEAPAPVEEKPKTRGRKKKEVVETNDDVDEELNKLLSDEE